MNKPIPIKPHHFLDIIKLYGRGLEKFVPDKKYGHDFYRIGNIILNNKETLLLLTLNGDDICKPCKYFKDGKCVDIVKNCGHYTSKEEWNKVIDTKTLKQLGLKESQKITALELCRIAKIKLNVFKIWKERPKEETVLRESNLINGIEKYFGGISVR